MVLGTVAFWVVVVLVIRALLPSGGADRPTVPRDALSLLDERLARGDVTPEEYEQRRRLIVDGR
jgi:putative membrane protein